MAKTISKSKQAYYTQYKSSSRWATNRKKKLERVKKQQPNNQQIDKAIGNISYRRGTPKTQVWSHSAIRIAKLFKEFTGRAPVELFSSNPTVQARAIQSFDPNRVFVGVPEGKVNFSLAARAHDKQGRLVWG